VGQEQAGSVNTVPVQFFTNSKAAEALRWCRRTSSYAWRWLSSLGKPREYGYVVMVHGTGIRIPGEEPGEIVIRGLYAKRIIRGGTEVAAREAAIQLVRDELRVKGCKLEDGRANLVVHSITRGLLSRTAPLQIRGFIFYGTHDGAPISE